MPALTVVHRDDDIAIVDKPAGMLVVPAPGRRGPTLVEVLTQQLERRVVAVHRLDEETTGALVLALSDAGRSGMVALFRHHAVERVYLALVAAAPSPPAGRIESNLLEGADGVVRVVCVGGQRAITEYDTIARRGRGALIRCRLETGRRNQIRVHMAALGCPLAGDRKYGFRDRPGERFPRVMLHSWRIAFEHPVRGGTVESTIAPLEAELLPGTSD